ncbi:MAG: hypothetical protein QXR58_00470 [Candidatus Micrarchaeaceae archaeon]
MKRSMKGQFAMLEVVLSSLMIASFFGIASGIIFSYSKTGGDSAPYLLYDFFEVSYRNATFGECAASPAESCTGLLPTLAKVYGMDYISISSGNETASYGSGLLCTHSYYMCAPIDADQHYIVTCVSACGG